MAVAPGAHVVLVLDQAGWHLSDKTHRAAEHHARPAADGAAGQVLGRAPSLPDCVTACTDCPKL
jgi:hypothetical protein